MKSTISVAQAKRRINDKLSHFFGVTPADATNEQYYKAVAMILREMLSEKNSQFRHQAEGQDSKQIYYLCMEFLMGRSLKNNLYNLGLTETFEKALAGFDVKLEQAWVVWLPVIWTVWPLTAISLWAIPFGMRPVFLSRSW